MDIDEIQKSMLAVPGVISVHDFHLWAITSGKTSLTAHVVYNTAYSPEDQLLPAVQSVLAKRFNVHHTTLQYEKTPCSQIDDGCNYVARTPQHEDH